MAARERSFLQLLLETTKAITASLDPDRVFELIVARVPQAVGVDAATIRLLDPSGKRLVLKAAHGLSAEYLDRGPVDAEPSVLEALAGTAIAVPDAANDPRVRYPEAARREGIRSLLVAPIPIRGKVGGVLRLLTRSPRSFDPEEIAFTQALAEQCGIAIENAQTVAELNRQLAYFKALAEIGRLINSPEGGLERVLAQIVQRLPEAMQLKACTIRLIDAAGRLELKAAHGLSRAYLERGPLDEELATYYILKGEPVVIPDATVDIHTLYHKEAAAEGVAGILAVPIAAKGETIGLLRLLSAEVRYFTPADINFALSVAEQVGMAVAGRRPG